MICKYTSGYIYQVVSAEFPWAVHSKDIVLLKHVAAKILFYKYTLADILYYYYYWCSWLLCLLEKHNALRLPFSASFVSFSS